MRWYEAVSAALAYKRCRPDLILWLERANIRLSALTARTARRASATARSSKATLGSPCASPVLDTKGSPRRSRQDVYCPRRARPC